VSVQLVGLDFGTTTMSAAVAEASLVRNAVTGRTDLTDVRERFRSELVFTPLVGERIDESAVARQVDSWLAAGGVRPGEVFGGGALLTGLTAQRDNAAALLGLIRARLGDALIATADDPCLESWLAFMGSCAGLSRRHPDLRVLNLDIGGGTTNLALGQAGEVLRTGCLFVGARHVQVVPGSYRIVRLSQYARELLSELGIRKDVDQELSEAEVEGIISYDLGLLEAATADDRKRFEEPLARLLEQVAFRPVSDGRASIITLSGGVGELVYSHLDGNPLPRRTAFGDLGIDLARRLAQSRWAEELRRYRPASAGRATVYGLLRHSTEISGSTIYWPKGALAEPADLPIVGRIGPDSSEDDVRAAFDLAGRSPPGACLMVRLGDHQASTLRAMGGRIAAALQICAFPADRPLVLLTSENVGKALGQYATRWGVLPARVLVLDEIPERNAQYVRIGRPRQQVVPVSFYGLRETGESS
jgi:ethanolamine utilization protein EutA